MYQSSGMRGGSVKQSAAESMASLANHPMRARGMLLSGVVVATYVQQEDTAPFVTPTGQKLLTRPVSVYCDVLTYSGRPEMHGVVLGRVPVAGSLGLHNGHVWKPRAAKINISGLALGAKNTDARDLDGDHVMVAFLDDNLQKPVITGRLTHPRASEGNDDLPQAGHRMLMTLEDGEPDLWKHQGTFYGVDQDGNFVVDTTRAHSGQYSATGGEQPAKDAQHGNVNLTLSNAAKLTVLGVEDQGTGAPSNEKFRMELQDGKLTIKMEDDANKALVFDASSGSFTVQFDATHSITYDGSKFIVKNGGASLEVDDKDGSAVLKVGDGAEEVPIYSKLKTFYSTMLKSTFLDVHQHSTGGTLLDGFGIPCSGTTGTPVSPSPSWDDSIKSTHVKMPTG